MATAKKQPASGSRTGADASAGPTDAAKDQAACSGPEQGSGGGGVFSVRRVRRLVQLMNRHGLAEVDLRQGQQRIRLRKTVEAAPAPPASYAPPAAAQPAAPSAPPAAPAAPAVDASLHTITSPMVGTYYNAASPDAAPFVKVGDQVGPDTTVCIVEAMKVFNEIPAECSGKIMAVLVETGEAVEFGQPMFRVQK
ncbi:Acetyl-CoA biotin carboxyl carrier [Pirellulimonas nuda]|uniref:Biotin carboxyl carrier protein of acetyl-CoA carboxylase n=1 Tax=Pirellulimonas nuda TaxID=2528009 RepID=A0A518D8F6_9BACT|nr:acetyl-CoA carboxylase biotin carboxyl carrier protein [Pirellulimonas nuda]QDU87762.1 Acetyl-CoA biotin carboxyl carrier [Pirellulimonas nuda]